MRSVITFTLPSPTSANDLHERRGSKVVKSAEYKAWITRAGQEILVQRAKMPLRQLPPGWFYARIRIALDDPADADNRHKALFDLLHVMGVTPDDKHLYGGSFGRSAKVARGTLVVTVRSIAKK